ncbi:hypothetical protein NJBCHELONAE_16960 [Mycobacteroides chelonae]|uniref:M50 family metallopeptidase n=1 Tax=Mycobacteroides chelonae TaxID=1774 RepID=UPI00223082B9|nr:hypothetical protein [Mycobacteroides chelonae]GLE56387.1 hypothetical protein NJBCHELONAE_16960 [Mycobacteroides chelonae]
MFLNGPAFEQFRAEQRCGTAHHEAGHAVAAVARGGTFSSFSIEPTTTYDGGVHVTHDRRHRDFVTFAGPWADARLGWGDRTLHGIDDNGLTFYDYVRTSMCVNAGDLRLYEPDRDLPRELFEADVFGGETPEIPLARDDAWYTELESYWPTIEAIAADALRGQQITPNYIVRHLNSRREC